MGALRALRAPKPPPRGVTSLSQLASLPCYPGGRLQGRCLALSAAVDKYKPVTRRGVARQKPQKNAVVVFSVKHCQV